MKIYEILKDENMGKTYADNTINEEWEVVRYEYVEEEKLVLVLETLKDQEDIKDHWDLTMEDILEMEFKEIWEDE